MRVGADRSEYDQEVLTKIPNQNANLPQQFNNQRVLQDGNRIIFSVRSLPLWLRLLFLLLLVLSSLLLLLLLLLAAVAPAAVEGAASSVLQCARTRVLAYGRLDKKSIRALHFVSCFFFLTVLS